MHKNSIILIVATLMLFSSFAVAFEASVTTYSSGPSETPQVSMGSTEIGNVTIYANGTVSNTSAVQQVGSTNTYDLLANINGTLYIQRNYTVVNGNGLTVTGGSSSSSSGAVNSSNTTGVIVENTVIGSTSYYGILFYHVASPIIDNVTTVNFTGNTVVQVYYSSNITVENGNFSVNGAQNVVYAEYDTSVNVSNNIIAGYITVGNFITVYYSGTSYVCGNSIMSNSSSTSAVGFEYGGNAIVANNQFNNTEYAVWTEYAGSLLSEGNTFTNTSYASLYGYYSTSITSIGDTMIFTYYPIYAEDVGSIYMNGDNIQNATDYFYLYGFGPLNILNTNYSYTSSYGFYLEYGGITNLLNDNISTDSSGAYAVFSYYGNGMITLANDSITAPNGYGLYLEYSPEFNVVNSYVNAYYGVYTYYESTQSIVHANMINDTFVLPYNGYAAYLYESNVYNVNFINNSVMSSASNLNDYGLYVDTGYFSANITVSGNSFLNNTYPVYLYAGSYGTNVKVLHNLFVNNSYAIEVFDYYSSVISSNTIINTSNEAIYYYAEGPGVIISNNTIVNMPGFGIVPYGIDLEYQYGGNNFVFNNTVINSGDAFYIYYNYGIAVYSNTVTNSGTAFYVYENYNITLFGNTVNTANTGIYSEYNYYFTYYGNTLNNANSSLYSSGDVSGFVFSNTFLDSQVNNSALYFLQISSYDALTFYHNNFINDTTNSTTLNSINSPKGPLFMNDLLPVGGNYYSNYTGSGTDGIGSTPMNVTGSIQDMHPLLNEWTSPTVTFVEIGLASGTQWSVKLGGNLMTVSGMSAIFQQANGKYTTETYSVMNVPGYTASVTSGTVSLDSSSSVVTVNFSPITYSVKFTEAGLANGTSWSVTLNGQTKTSATQDITFSVSNGSYSYTIGSVNGYTTTASTGTVQVSGTSQSETVQFKAVTYTLTVDQTGLPSGDAWAITIANKTYNSTGDSISVQLVSGAYNISVSGPSGYTVSLQSSNVTMNNGNGTFNVTFSASKGAATSTSAGSLYAGIGIGAIVGAVAGLVGTMFYTGTGIFSRSGE